MLKSDDCMCDGGGSILHKRGPRCTSAGEHVIGLPKQWRKDRGMGDLEWVTWRFEYPGRSLTPEEQAELDAFEAECYRKGEWPEEGQMVQLRSERRVWLMQAPSKGVQVDDDF